jgi:hypothetical protein
MRDGDTLELTLPGTGIRNRSDLSAVTASVGGVPARVTAAEPSEEDGVDLIRLILPPALAGRGIVDIIVQVDGKMANPVFLNIESDGDDRPIIAWNFNVGAEGWTPVNVRSQRVWEGVWSLDPNPTGGRPWVVGPSISVSPSDYKYVQVRMAIPACSGTASVYFRRSGDNNYAEERRVRFSPRICASCDTAPFVSYSIPMHEHALWASAAAIAAFRIDPCNTVPQGAQQKSVEIDFIRLSPNP